MLNIAYCKLWLFDKILTLYSERLKIKESNFPLVQFYQSTVRRKQKSTEL